MMFICYHCVKNNVKRAKHEVTETLYSRGVCSVVKNPRKRPGPVQVFYIFPSRANTCEIYHITL